MKYDMDVVEGKITTENEPCKTGIEELDKGLGGGIPPGSAVLMPGSSGSGKTTLCMQFLINGAKQGKRGIFFTTTEPLFKLTKNMDGFSFYDKKLIESGMVNLIECKTIGDRFGNCIML
jgi:circadian clock protein KaiC